MTIPMMQKVLGEDWDLLPEVIQRHYRISDGQQSCLEGTLTIDYPNAQLPMVWLIHLFGGLLLWRGQAAQVRVEKTVGASDGDVLDWHRTITYPDGRSDYFRSRMQFVAEHQVIETIGFGFGLLMDVVVDEGGLRYRSLGHFWQWRGWRLPIPDWLLLGSATISERALSEDVFYLDFTIRHPLWGVSYCYRGDFRHV